jgi:hypothetical protein
LSRDTVRELKKRHSQHLALGQAEAYRRASRTAETARRLLELRLRRLDPTEGANDEERQQRAEKLDKVPVRELAAAFSSATDKARALEVPPPKEEGRQGLGFEGVRELQARIVSQGKEREAKERMVVSGNAQGA